MTFEYILKAGLSREPSCGPYSIETRQSEIENIVISHEYAEPGYTNPFKLILFANWNMFPRGIDTLLERYGYSIEWSDEWTTCCSCDRAVRTSPDSYSYQPSYVIFQDDVLCLECLNGDAENYLTSLENNPKTALNIASINPAEYGYTLIQGEYEAGLHEYMTDDPKTIYAQLHNSHSRLLFQVDSVSQFSISFSVWEKIS